MRASGKVWTSCGDLNFGVHCDGIYGSSGNKYNKISDMSAGWKERGRKRLRAKTRGRLVGWVVTFANDRAKWWVRRKETCARLPGTKLQILKLLMIASNCQRALGGR
ncbi:hypothetical protein AG1IA_06595 [Rhizoctonia solani AG-1 IA]|uniref:Uncharacterized protein n=1 Tax=Thanatephorus cucumeris (strain AG1-IA) TaxID=983506 RepID=L8WRK6_THACA|nr:hypothetical protein AG1IA_06595 [Rhizoctonia solani AG-1 IA]